jgi:hypothetical protein
MIRQLERDGKGVGGGVVVMVSAMWRRNPRLAAKKNQKNQ